MCRDENRDHLSQLLVMLQVNVSPRGRLESRWSVWPRSSIPAIGLAVSVVIWSAESQSSRHNTPSAISQWFSLLKSHLILGPSAASRLTNKLPWLTLSLSLLLFSSVIFHSPLLLFILLFHTDFHHVCSLPISCLSCAPVDVCIFHVCIYLSPRMVGLCFALEKTSIANFRFVLMVSRMSCFQLSDEFLFAELHLSSPISPQLHLSLPLLLLPPPPSEGEAQLVEQIIYSCLSPNSALYCGEMRDGKMERQRRARAVFLSHNCRRQKQMDDSFSLLGLLSSLNTLKNTKHIPCPNQL